MKNRVQKINYTLVAAAVLLLGSQLLRAQEVPRRRHGPSPKPAAGALEPAGGRRQPPPPPPGAPHSPPGPTTPRPGAAGGQPGSPPAAGERREGGGEIGSLPGEKEFNDCLRIPPHKRLKFTLKPESDLMDLVGWISHMTCKKFIVATSLRAQKVTLISPEAVTPGEAYRAFLSALEVMGLSVAPAGNYLKIVQGNWAIQASIPTYADKDQKDLPSTDAVVTQLVRVQNVDANELALVLNKMKSRAGDVTTYKPTNSLIITDNALNVKRMLELIRELDIPSEGEKIWVIRMLHADVEEVKKILDQLFGQKAAGNASGGRPAGALRAATGPGGAEEDVANLSASKIVTDQASNSIIIVASATSFARIASLIKKLDVEAEGINQKINVYYLENGDAEAMANTLASLTGAAGSRGTAGRGHAGGATPRPAARPATGGGTLATLFEGEVRISADKATNSLVIVASAKDFMNLRGVIKKLDIPRRQVFVEATIMEVNLNTSRKLGFSYHGAGPTSSGDTQTIIFGGVEDGTNFNSFLLNPTSLMGLAAGARMAPIAGSGKILGTSSDVPAFGVMFQALQTAGNVNVLSSPHLLTTDNEAAEIAVGQNLPFQGSVTGAGFGTTSSSTGTATTSLLPALSVQRQDVVLKLDITPHVNDSDMVRLELKQEVQDIVDKNFNNLGPATSKRSAKTMVVVRDQQTVVIGGLMSNRMVDTQTKVPLLGDIPILGYFFKNTSKEMQKTNLLIVLTPYVIRDQSDLRRIFTKKLQERREFIRRYTSFGQQQDITQDIDFRHKRGLLSEINKVADQADSDAKLILEAKKRKPQDVEPVEMPKGMTPPSPSPSAPSTPGPGDGAPGTGAGIEQPPASPSPPIEISPQRQPPVLR